jgi:hypothetical protein
MKEPGNIVRVIQGEPLGSLVTPWRDIDTMV